MNQAIKAFWMVTLTICWPAIAAAQADSYPPLADPVVAWPALPSVLNSPADTFGRAAGQPHFAEIVPGKEFVDSRVLPAQAFLLPPPPPSNMYIDNPDDWPASGAPLLNSAAPLTIAAPEQPAVVIVVEPEKLIEPIKPPWSSSVELGLNGASGNSELIKLRSAFSTKHENEQHILTFDVTYNYSTSHAQETENRALAKNRYEWLFANSAWSVFDEDELEYDEFKSYDLRVSDHGGVAYMIFKNDITKFKGRAGVGESWKFGGPDAGGTTEALFGLEYERHVSNRQKLTMAGEVFPALNSLGDFRSDAKIAYELLVDPIWNITLKLGASDRYDTQATGKKPNDVEYFGVLLWKF